MNVNSLVQPEDLSIIVEEAYIKFLQTAPGDVLARLLLTLSLGIRISCVSTSIVPPEKMLVVGFVETVGNFAKPSWDDWEPDIGLADYVPESSEMPLLSIDEYLERWHVNLPTFLNGTDNLDDFRRTQFENVVASSPGLRILANKTLEARIDDGVRKKLYEICDRWLYNQPGWLG